MVLPNNVGEKILRFLIYIAITAITRVLAVDIKEMEDIHIMYMTSAILILTLAVLALKIGSEKFPSHDKTGDKKPAQMNVDF